MKTRLGWGGGFIVAIIYISPEEAGNCLSKVREKKQGDTRTS